MRNDIRDGEVFPMVRRTLLSSVLSAAALLGAAGTGALALIDALGVSNRASAGQVLATVPITDGSPMAGAFTGARVQVESAGSTFVPVLASGVPGEVTAQFLAAQWFSTIITVLLAVAVAAAAAGVLAGRLRWGLLSRLTIAGGAVLAVGSLVAQLLLKSAAESLSWYLQPADAPWVEPGFVAGVDFGGTLTGLVIVLLGLAFGGSARLARDADGVV